MKNQLYKISEKVVQKISDIVEFVNKYMVIAFFTLLLCISTKEFMKNIMVTVGIDDGKIKNIFENFQKLIEICIYFFTIYLGVLILYCVLKKVYIFIYKKFQYDRYRKMLISDVDNSIKELYKNIYDYFSNTKNNTPIFITGEWGAGKTYRINDFLNNYYKYSKNKIYKISCFGVTTKEVLMDRIAKACENEDKSVFNNIMALIGEIPVIGEFLKSVLEKKYEINNIKQNSIFIFDNFERIDWAEYNIDSGNTLERKNNYDNAISKYNIVAGVIDELIEKYNMKIIIVGNENEMVPGFVYNTFICKLGCKKYTVNPNGKVFKQVWDEIVEKDIDVKNYLNELNLIFDKINLTTQLIWNISDCKNIRIIYKITYNYIQYMLFLWNIDYRFTDEINEEISLYYTNLIINLFRKRLLKIRPYESIGLYFRKEAIRTNIKKYASLGSIDAMWCSDESINSYLLNLEQNFNELSIIERNFVKEYTNNYLSLKKCTDKDIDIKRIDFEDVACLLITARDSCLDNIYKWFEKDIINFEDPNEIVKIIDIYKLDEIFVKNNLLLNYFFKNNSKNEESIFISSANTFCNNSKRFKRMYEKYIQLNKK